MARAKKFKPRNPVARNQRQHGGFHRSRAKEKREPLVELGVHARACGGDQDLCHRVLEVSADG